MKCNNCGAEIGNSKVCEFCGSQISYDMRKEQEQVNKQGCPQCGSSNIQFRRENQGEIRGKKSKQVVHRTVGFCKDCGYTWYPSGANSAPQKNNLIWWILGWLFFFPAPVMVLIWRKKNTWDIKIKIAVTVAFWVLIFALGSSGNSSDSSSKDTSTTKVEETTNNENSEQTGTDDKSAEDTSENLEIIYELNDDINRYINYFNEANPDTPITSEMAQPYNHHGSDHKNQIKFIDNKFEIVITDGKEVYIGYMPSTSYTNDEYKEMYKKYLKGFALGLSDSDMDADWDTIMNDLTHNVKFDTYSADVYMPSDKITYMTITKK